MFFSTRSTAFLVATMATVSLVQANLKPIYPVKGRYEINTPKEYAKYWNNEDTSNSVNPCLFGSIVAPDDDGEVNVKYLYPSGFDVTWAGGYLSLQQYLTWNANSGIDSNTLIDNMAMAVGFPPNYFYNSTATPTANFPPVKDQRNNGEWVLYVFDGCRAAKRGNAPEIPTPAFWLNRLKTLYGIQVPKSSYNDLTANFWNVEMYTGCVNTACWGAKNFASDATTDCDCFDEFTDALDKFGKADPFGSSVLKRTKNDDASTKNCYSKLSDDPNATELRAALAVCEAAGAWNTGNGVGWNFANVANDGPVSFDSLPNVEAGMTYPEYVFENDSIQKLGAVRMSMGEWK